MKKLFKLTALASAVFLLGACADETVLNPEQAREAAPESNAIQFGTYMGKSGLTRAGSTGSIDTDKLKESGYGFGVFAYYTNANSYATKRLNADANDNLVPNFMYNQKVEWNNALPDAYITKWAYSPIKYWPNELTGTAGTTYYVDDQEKDASNDPAYQMGTNGGNLSFFAYAPYVAVNQTTATSQTGATPSSGSTTEGIVAISGNKWAGNDSKANPSDPFVKYIIPFSTTPTVDLLWGTRGNTNKNVLEENNTGITGIMPKVVTPSTDDEQYKNDILKTYTLNADLTKQKTTGTVDFAFKHALSKVGGSDKTDGGKDDDATTPTHGLMIVLDIDDQMGAEQGGLLEAIGTSDPLYATLFDADKCKYKTKVTVKDINIKVKYQIKKSAVTITDGVVNPSTYDPSTDKEFLNIGGMLNLATGTWTLTRETLDDKNGDLTGGDDGVIEHDINQTGSGVAGQLQENIREPESFTQHTLNGFKSELPIGVTTVPKNVYEDEANPLVFIPGTYPILTIQVDYIVRTYDDNLSGKYSEVEQVIAKDLAFMKETELNKQYNVLIHLGLTSVKFTASVSDWEISDLGYTSTTDPITGDEVPLYTSDADVYVPKNVEGEVKAVALAQFDDKNTGADLSDDGKTITLSSLTYKNATLTETDDTDVDLGEVPTAEANIQLFAGAKIEKKETAGTYTYTDVTKNALYTITYKTDEPTNYSTLGGWITVDANGKVTVAANEGTKKRQATITATYGNQTSASITITQRRKSLLVSVEKSSASESSAATPLEESDKQVSAAGGNWNAYKVFATRQERQNSDDAGVGVTTREDVTSKAVFISGSKPEYVTLGQNKVTFTANQLAVAVGNTRTATVKAKYLGVESGDVVLTQNANTTLTLTPTWSATITSIPSTGAVLKLTEVTATYNSGVTGEEHGPYTVTSSAVLGVGSEALPSGVTITGKTITIPENTTGADRTIKVKVTYNSADTGDIIITQLH